MATLTGVFDDVENFETFDSVFGGFLEDELDIDVTPGSTFTLNKANTVGKVVTEDGYTAVFTSLKTSYKMGKDDDAVVVSGTGNTKVIGSTGNNDIIGNEGNNNITAGNGDDTVKGGAGNDIINGGSGADKLLGEEGNDKILGTAGDDSIYGGAGNDVIDGGADDDYMDGGVGNDQIAGGAGDDVLIGGGGKDTLNGGAGDDTVIGSEGNDLMVGGTGSDSFVIGNDSGFDIVVDFGIKTNGAVASQFEDKLYIMDSLGGGAAHTGDDDTFDVEDFSISMAADDSGVIIAFADGGSVLLKGLDEEDMADLNLQEDEGGVYFTLA